MIFSNLQKELKIVHNFKAEVQDRCPGSVVEIDTKSMNGKIYFNRFFMALSPCITGFKEGCRPYLSVDGTVLTGRWKGTLASATALDGHNWMFPVAFGLFEKEDEENWTWFMRQLKRSIGEVKPLAICTDACKGLANAVKTVFPQTEGRECHAHLMLNLYRLYMGTCFQYMWPAARAYRPTLSQAYLEKVFAGCADFDKYLDSHHAQLWRRSQFNTD